MLRSLDIGAQRINASQYNNRLARTVTAARTRGDVLMSNDESQTKPLRKRGRWFSFSIRTLLIAMTLCCIVLWLWMKPLIRQGIAVRRFYELTDNRDPSVSQGWVTMGYRYEGKDQYYKPLAYKWLHPLLGEESFGEVTGVQLLYTSTTNEDLRYLADVPTVERVLLSNTKVTDEGLRYLLACPKLKGLQLEGLPITDEGLTQLLALKELETITLSGTKITDAGLAHLAKLPNLKRIWVRNTAVTDAGLEHLAKLPKMEVIGLSGTAITDAGYQKLEAALPNCEIQADLPRYTQKFQLQNQQPVEVVE
jgi:hypothetical protein